MRPGPTSSSQAVLASQEHLDGDLRSYAYLVAGPPSMVEAVVETLRDAGIPDEQVSADRFSGY